MRALTMLLAAALAWAASGCGGSEETEQVEVDVGRGIVVEVESGLEGKEYVLAVMQAIYDDELELVAEVEDCVIEELSDAPAAELDRLPDLPESDRETAFVDLSNRYAATCIEGGEEVVVPDPGQPTLTILRAAIVAQIAAGYEEQAGEPLTAPKRACLNDQLEAFPDEDLIEVVNSNSRQQSQQLFRTARGCF